MSGLTDPKSINKVLDEATQDLEALYLSLSKGYEDVDYTPKRSQDLLDKIRQIANMDPKVISEYPRKGIFREVVNKITPRLDSSSAQTALGSAAADLMGIFKKIQLVFEEESQYKRVSRKDSDPLGNR